METKPLVGECKSGFGEWLKVVSHRAIKFQFMGEWDDVGPVRSPVRFKIRNGDPWYFTNCVDKVWRYGDEGFTEVDRESVVLHDSGASEEPSFLGKHIDTVFG